MRYDLLDVSHHADLLDSCKFLTEQPADLDTDAPACEVSDVGVSIDSWDAAMGASAATLVVTNQHTDDDCQLHGAPDFQLIQGGEDLDLQVDDLDPSPENSHDLHSDITIGPGDTAKAILYWRSERRTAPPAQRAQVNFNGEWVEAELDLAYFDTEAESLFDVRQRARDWQMVVWITAQTVQVLIAALMVAITLTCISSISG